MNLTLLCILFKYRLIIKILRINSIMIQKHPLFNILMGYPQWLVLLIYIYYVLVIFRSKPFFLIFFTLDRR